MSNTKRGIVRKEFFLDKGIMPNNSQGEPDVEYVEWLEDEKIDLEAKLIEYCTNYEEAQIVRDEKIKGLEDALAVYCVGCFAEDNPHSKG